MLQLTAPQIDTLRMLRKTHPALPFVLIGASALSAHISLGRMTGDIDLVIVAPMKQMVAMLESLGWQRHPRALHRWRCVDGAVADILPAADEGGRENAIVFEDGCVMSTVGFDLAFRHAVSVPLAEDLTVQVASLATIVILKMVAWLDRPAERLKDLDDLTRILEDSLDDDDVRRWDPDHPIGASQLDVEGQSFFSVGVDVGSIAEASHRDVIARFLDKLRDEGTPAFARMLRASRDAATHVGEQRLRRLLDAFEAGTKLSSETR